MVPPDVPFERSKRQQRGIKLAEAYFNEKKNQETQAYTRAREDLADYCFRYFTMLVKASVYGGLYPRSLGRSLSDECISVLHESTLKESIPLSLPITSTPFSA